MKTLEACLKKHSDLLIERYAILEACRKDIINACLIMEETYEEDQKLLIACNGRSAADSEHIAGELMKRFKILCTVTPKMAEKLKAIDPVRGENLTKNLEHGLIAIPLVAHEALSTAYINDVDGLDVFAQQLLALAVQEMCFLASLRQATAKT